MIFAAIGDIHGNCAALEAVLEDIARLGIKDIVNLGDCFSGPLEAGFTGDVLVSNWIPSIRGNHDRELIERAPEEMGSWERPAHAQLSAAHLDWLQTLPFSMVFKDIAYCCHGSPLGDLDYWLETLSPEGVLETAAADRNRGAGGRYLPAADAVRTHAYSPCGTAFQRPVDRQSR